MRCNSNIQASMQDARCKMQEARCKMQDANDISHGRNDFVNKTLEVSLNADDIRKASYEFCIADVVLMLNETLVLSL
jgi:hypothetical protein